MSWKLVAHQSSVAYGEVIATGEHEAWAFGWKVVGLGAWLPMADGPHRPTAFRWNGDRWTKSGLPVKRGSIGPVAASGPANLWALAGAERETRVLRWNGHAWTIAHKLPASAGALAVTGDDDVWVFSDHLAWHYDGAAWSERSLAFQAFRVSARSASDIWALGAGTLSAHHFDGTAWTPVDLTAALPQVQPPPADLPPGLHRPRVSAITADPSGVWITGDIGVSSFLLYRTDSGWRGEDISTTAGRLARALPPVPDGRGGHWFLGSTDVNGHDSALAHRDPSGHWTRTPAGGELTSLSAFPGGPLLATGVIGRASGVFSGDARRSAGR